jgi:hypothetical protein
VLIDSTDMIEIKAARGVNIQAGTILDMHSQIAATVSASSLTFWAAGTAELGGSVLRLNKGSKPMARSGDVVVVAPGGAGAIRSGNPTILG